MNLTARELAHIGGLVAAAFVIKLPLLGIPNVEPFLLTYFFIGFRFGPGWGLTIGAAAEFLYSTLNPFGPAIPPVLLAQVLGMGLAGLIGGILASWNPWDWLTKPNRIGLAILGGVITLFYDLATNLAMVATLGSLWAWLIAGIPFSALHIVSNCLLFAVVFPALCKIVPAPQRRQPVS